MQFEDKMHPQKMGFRDYIEALEEERKKIQVFTRELPLSLELVTQGKTNLKHHRIIKIKKQRHPFLIPS